MTRAQLIDAIASALPSDGSELQLGLVGTAVAARYGHQFAHKNAHPDIKRHSHGSIKKFIEDHPQQFALREGTDSAKSPFVRLLIPHKTAVSDEGASGASFSWRRLHQELAAPHVTKPPAQQHTSAFVPTCPTATSPEAASFEFPSSSASSAAAAGAGVAAVPHIVRLQVHVTGVEKTLQCHADSVEELRTETLDKLEGKELQVTLPQPIEFSIVPPSADDDAPSVTVRPLLTDAQLWSLSKNTSVWVLPHPNPTSVRIVLPGVAEPILSAAFSLPHLHTALAEQLTHSGSALSEGVSFSLTAPTAAAPAPRSLHSWSEVTSLPAPVTLFAVWRWCAVPLSVQRLIHPQLDAERGTCGICKRPFAHQAHLGPTP